jgi:hypothetical protein
MITCRVRSAVALFFLAISCRVVSAEPRLPIVPDLEALRDTCLELIADARKQTFPDANADASLKRIAFDRIECNRQLVPPEKWGSVRDVYLVQVAEYAEWYKESLSYVLILRPRPGGFERLLVYAGGFSESSLDWETVDLGDRKYFEEMNAFHPIRSLMIRDHSSGTGLSQERLLLFRYDGARDCFRNIFDTRLSFSASNDTPYKAFRSTVEFRKPRPGGLGRLKDIVITTDWFVSRPNDTCDLFGSDSTLDRRVSVISWDGEKYAGRFDLPPNAELSHLGLQGQWFPAEGGIQTGQPQGSSQGSSEEPEEK